MPQTFTLRPCFLALGAVALTLISGCAKPEHGAVEGIVTLNGKPLPSIKLSFIPDHTKGTRSPYTSAVTNDQGKYRLETVKGDDGAVVGHYVVTMRDLLAIQPGAKSRLPAAYESAKTTPLGDVEVKTGRNTLDFELAGKTPTH